MLARALALAIPAVLLAVAAGCTQSVRATGAGSDVAARVRQALVDGHSGIDDHRYSRAVEVDAQTQVTDAQRRWSPQDGRFAYLVKPVGKFEGTRVVEISISPWDERNEIERTVEVGAWHWNIVPPFTKGPDSDLVDAVAQKLRAQLQQPRANAQPPNVVVILVDDLGWRDIGVYGETFARTPRIDELASRSVIFDAAYASCPVCSPTRAALLTGKSPPAVGITDWIPGDGNGSTPLIGAKDLDHLPLAEVTIAERLKSRGYETYHVGKWHLGGEGYLPQDQGFDVNIMGSHTGHPATYFWPYGNAVDQGVAANDGAAAERVLTPAHSHAVRALPPGGKEGEYLTDRQGEEAARLIRDAAARGKQFFLYLPYYTVHSPLEAQAWEVEEYRALKRKRGLTGAKPRPVYAAMVESLDRSVGVVLDALADAGVDSNTLIVFTSDNGGAGAATDNLPLRAAKRSLYEGGVRVPLIVKWPGRNDGGRRVDAPVISTDVFATVCDAAGAMDECGAAVAVEEVGAPARPIEGRSLAPIVMGAPNDFAGRALYWHFPHYQLGGVSPAGSVRQGDWKLIEFFEDGRVELYNLREDPSESNNLAAAQPERAAQLVAQLASRRASVGAQMPSANAGFRQR